MDFQEPVFIAPPTQATDPSIAKAALMGCAILGLLVAALAVPLMALSLILGPNTDGWTSLIVLLFVGIPALVIALIAFFLIARRLLQRQGWSSPGLTVAVVLLVSSAISPLSSYLPPQQAYLIFPIIALAVIASVIGMGRYHPRNSAVGAAMGLIILGSLWATGSLTSSFGNIKLSQNQFDAIGTPLWLTEKAPLRLAPYEVSRARPTAAEGKHLMLKTPMGVEIYESRAPQANQAPSCGEYYPGSSIPSYAETPECRQIGEIQPGVLAAVDNEGNAFATFGTTLVVLRSVNASTITSDELVAYLKTFRQLDSAAASKLVSRNYSLLKSTVARQAELASFIPLLPAPSPPNGYKLKEMLLVSFIDPEKPTLRVSYEQGNNGTIALWVGPQTPAFQPPASCGQSSDLNYGGVNPCKLIETAGANKIYQSDDSYFYFVHSGNTVTAIDARGSGKDDIRNIARTFKPASKDIFKQAKTVNY